MSTNGSTASVAGAGRTASEHFDVIIVGARCAGSPLAVLLARAGMKVAVVEQATFPRAVVSSSFIEADGLLFLKRLGMLEPVRETGVRFMKRTDMRLNDLRIAAGWPLRFDDVGGGAFLRRHLLDSILAEGAAEAGADVRMGTKVVEVLWDRQRVSGVRVQHEGSETRLHAPLVVGADGRNSTVAYMCGARKYNITHNQRSYYYTFFEGADPAYCDLFVFHRWGDKMIWSGPADSGLYLVGVSPEVHERDYFRSNAEAGLLAHMRSCEPTAKALTDAHIATKVFGITKFDGFFRQASGRGWVLAGDSGHHKDPSSGRGIGDAFMQVEMLAPVIISGLGGSGGSGGGLDSELRRWGERRDRQFEGHYWLATQLGMAGAFPTVLPEAVRRLQERGELDRFFDLFSHRSRYYDVFALRDVGLATGHLLRSGTYKRGPLLKEAITLLAHEPRRRWINRHPDLAPSDVTAAPADRLRPADGAPADRLRPANGAAANGTAAAPGLVTDGSR